MDFWERCTSKEGAGICMTGLLLGMVLTLLIVWIYMVVVKGERFTNPNDLDAQTKAILAKMNAADPPSDAAMKRMYGVR